MIDISKEELLTLAEAAERLPPRRNGKRPHASTLYRWARDGVNGVHLSVLIVGNTTCTSMNSLQRMFDALTAAALPESTKESPKSERRQQVDAALSDLGM